MDVEWKDFSKLIEFRGISTFPATAMLMLFSSFIKKEQVFYFLFIETPEIIDMSHTIHELYFNEGRNQNLGLNAMKGFQSKKEIPEIGSGITYNYFLDIMEENHFDTTKNTAR